MLSYSTIPVPEKLHAFVRHVWVIEFGQERATSVGEEVGRLFSIYADGCPGLIFQQSENGLLLNQKKKLSPVFLYGQTVAPIDMHSAGRSGMIVVCFHPYALHSLFKFSAKELTDDCLDISLLSAVRGRQLRDRLWNTGTAHEQVSMLFNYLEQVVEKNKAMADLGMAHATSRLFQSNGKMPLPALQRMLNLSPRTFERRFEQYIGISPKLFSRIAQFQAALKHLQSGKFDKLSDIAYTYGYADQSHFIRNFSRFTGLSPLRWQKHAYAGEDASDFPGMTRPI
ncbi:MAG: AraC family transcriptional regulator [Sphingobacteriales bacterium]|nr:AraC family transcriptional regulator [Sphingobacteriales bacterium]